MRPSDVTQIAPRAGSRRSPTSIGNSVGNAAGFAVAAAFACLFLVPLAGGVLTALDVGAEYLLALLLPAACVYMAFVTGAHQGLLISSLISSVSAAALLLKFRGLGASTGSTLFTALLLGRPVVETASKFFGGSGLRINPPPERHAADAVHPRFAHYIKAAPGR